MRMQRRGSAGLKVLACWVLFIGGALAGLMAMGHHPEEVLDALLSKTTGVVLDEMAARGMIPTAPKGKDLSAMDVDQQIAAIREHYGLPSQHTQQQAHSTDTPIDSGHTATPLQRSKKRSQQSDRGQATLAYWNKVNEIIAREGAMRTAPSDITAVNAEGFVAARLRAFRYAATALNGLKARNVDPEVAAHVQHLIVWYEEGAELNQHATHLLTEASDKDRKGSEGRGWQDAEKAHYESVQRLNQRGEELRQRMTRRYGIDFPAML